MVTYPYRGAGRPEAAIAIERTMDLLARRLGIDPIELRRRNFIPPDAFPYDTPTGRRYDSGNYAAALDLALETVGYEEWRAEQARRRSDPDALPLGIGVSCYVERSGGEPGGLHEFGSLEVHEDGTVTARCGAARPTRSPRSPKTGPRWWTSSPTPPRWPCRRRSPPNSTPALPCPRAGPS